MCLKTLVEMCQYDGGQDLSIRWKEVQTMDSNVVLDFYGIPQTVYVQGIEQALHHLYHEMEQVGEPFTNISYRFKKAGDLRAVPQRFTRSCVSSASKGTICSTINGRNGWRGVFSLSTVN